MTVNDKQEGGGARGLEQKSSLVMDVALKSIYTSSWM